MTEDDSVDKFVYYGTILLTVYLSAPTVSAVTHSSTKAVPAFVAPNESPAAKEAIL